MKQTLATFLLVCFAGIVAFSQSLSLSYNQQTLPVNGTLVRTGSPDSLEMTSWLKIKNESGKLIHVQEKKVELMLANGAAGSICWAGFCYNPTIFESLHPLALDAGEERIGCFAHFTPGGSIGESLVRWVFFDRDNPSDSVSVTIHYITYPSAINETNMGPGYLSLPYPNPADKSAGFHHSLSNGDDAELVIRNTGGNIVKRERVPTDRDLLTLTTASLDDGIYYCSLVVKGRVTAVRKMVVVH